MTAGADARTGGHSLPARPPRRLGALASLAPAALFASVILLALVGGLRLVTVEEDALLAGVAIDDTYYFLIPAQHFVAGEGFSFDGLRRTSGVQPLWAIVTVGVVAVVRDAVAAMRVLCGLSGLLWIGAGVLWYRTLAHRDRWAALLAATLWILAGFREHMAFTGMENGLHGFLFAAVAAVTVRFARTADAAGSAPRRYLVTGALVGLFALTRTEGGLLLPMLGVVVLAGLVRLDGRAARPDWQGAVCYSLPPAVLLGAWATASVAYFGDLTPVSGSVKLFYESQWGNAHGGALASLWHHVVQVAGSSYLPVQGAVQDVLHDRLGLGVTHSALAPVLGAVAAVAVAAALVTLWRKPDRSPAAVWWTLAVFALAHLGMMAVLLSRFTAYGKWYFSCEIAMLAVALAVGLRALLRGSRLGAAWPWLVLLMWSVTVTEKLGLLRPSPHVTDSPFLQSGRFANEHLPAGRRIGALSSGALAFAADRHTVVNLDGLMNDHEYLEKFLEPGRLPEYLRREGIEYFSDYKPVPAWKDGVSWHGRVPLEDVALLRWWRMDHGLAYCLFRLWPSSTPHRDPVDRFSRIEFDAEVLGKHEVLADAELESELGDRMVASSYPSTPSGALRHVVMPVETYRALGIASHDIAPATSMPVRFGGELRLLGFDLCDVRASSRSVVVTCYWQLVDELGDPRVHLGDAPLDDAAPTGLARCSLSPGDLPAGSVVADTRTVPVPARGRSLWLGVRSDGAWLEPRPDTSVVRHGPRVMLVTFGARSR